MLTQKQSISANFFLMDVSLEHCRICFPHLPLNIPWITLREHTQKLEEWKCARQKKKIKTEKNRKFWEKRTAEEKSRKVSKNPGKQRFSTFYVNRKGFRSFGKKNLSRLGPFSIFSFAYFRFITVFRYKFLHIVSLLWVNYTQWYREELIYGGIVAKVSSKESFLKYSFFTLTFYKSDFRIFCWKNSMK